MIGLRLKYLLPGIIMSSAMNVLPNPSGVVDFRLRRPSGNDSVSFTAGIDPLASPFVSGTVSLGGGRGKAGLAGRAAFYPGGSNFRGGENRNFAAGVAGFAPLSADLNVSAFAEIEDYREQSSPTYFTSGPFLPPRVRRGEFLGQPWAIYQYRTTNTGLILDWRPTDDSELRAGLFRSTYDLRSGAYDLITRLDPAGNGRRLIYIFPPEDHHSVSGEVRYRRLVETGRFRLTGTASFRGRTVDRRRGGAAVADLGEVNLHQPTVRPEPALEFGRERNDAVDQIGVGLHGRIEWNRRLDISFGVQKTRYEQSVLQADDSNSMTSSPWLYQLLAAWSPSPGLAIYASASNGLEESGIAPAQAINRGEVLPATITNQQEVGFRATRGPMTLTVSGFALSKPYPNLDAGNRYGFVGTTRHRGVEVSLAGQPVPGLDLIAGALYLDAQVEQRIGDEELTSRSVGQPRYRLLLSANYRLPRWKQLSFDASVTFQGDRVAKLNPLVPAPDYALVNGGIRYQIRPNLLARAELRNIFDSYGFTVASTSAFGYVAGRSLRVALTWTP